MPVIGVPGWDDVGACRFRLVGSSECDQYRL